MATMQLGRELVPQSVGYGLLIGLGVAFCGVILIALKIQKAYLSEDSGTSEMFMVANRSVGVGLTASAVFSSWMWINETVLAAALCYRYGVALPLWYASGLCFQIALMAALGVVAKIRVPYAHTSLEIIQMRYGKIGHVVFIILNLINNVFGCAAMILTGSQLIYGISGMHFAAATILLPLGVILYTAIGGLKATFLTDYLHTTIALILIMYFTLSTLTNEHIGGLGGLYDKVMANASSNIVEGNYKGSLLTFKSQPAIIWALILKFGNLALVVMDTAFWQKSFATEVNATVPGYNLAALAIFGIPWGLGTVFGMTARAIHDTPLWPTYPAPLTLDQINAGLVMPYTIKALIGEKGIVAFFVLLFMALTSTISSSMIAVSSILSFDVYKTYMNPRASDKRLVKVSHVTVVIHGIFITGVALALNYGGANMTWLGYLRPVITCPGIIPLALTLLWRGQTRLAAVLAPILGFLTGLAIWLGTSKSIYGAINLTTTGMGVPALYGAIAAFFSPALYSVLISQYKPYRFDWRIFLRIELADEAQLARSSAPESITTGLPLSDDATPTIFSTFLKREASTAPIADTSLLTPNAEHAPAVTKKNAPVLQRNPSSTSSTPKYATSLESLTHPFDAATLQRLHWWHRIAWAWFVLVVLVTFVVWPMPLYRDYIFSRKFFAGWVTVAIFWQFFAFFAVAVYPLYDGRREIAKGARGVWVAVGRKFGASN